MKLKNLVKQLYRTSNALIIFQMIIAPVAISAEEPSGAQRAADGIRTFSELLQKTSQAYVAGRQGNQNQGGSFQQLQDQLRLRPVDQAQIPPVFSGCLVLSASGNKLSTGLKCSNVTDQQLKAGYASALIEVADLNLSDLENFQTEGHERFTTQGVGCYKKKLSDFEQRLKIREEEIAKLKNFITEGFNRIEQETKLLKENVEKDEALLSGKNLDKFFPDGKFTGIFLGTQDNGICGSVISGDQLEGLGQKGGLRDIEDNLFKIANSADNGLSPRQLTDPRVQNNIKSDVKKLARKIADNMLNDGKLQADGISAASSSQFVTSDNKALQESLKQFDEQMSQKEKSLVDNTKVSRIPGSQGPLTSLLSEIKSNSFDNGDIRDKLKDYKNSVRKSCLQNNLKQFGGPNGFARSFKDPLVSKSFSKDADSGLATHIVDAFNKYDDIDDFLDEIKGVQHSKSGRPGSRRSLYSRYIMTTGKSFKIGDQIIGASTPLRPAQLAGLLVTNCNNKFESDDIDGSGLSAADMQDAVAKFAVGYNRLKNTAKNTLLTTVSQNLLTCPDKVSTANTSLACTPGSNSLDINNAGFCLAKATACSNNIIECSNRARQEVGRVKAHQKTNADQYNQKILAFKQSLKAQFANINKFMEAQARSLDAQLNIGSVFGIPQEEDVDESDKFLQGFDGELKLHDPEAYKKVALDRLDKMLEKVKKQREEFVGPESQNLKTLASSGKLGQMADKYIQNYKSETSKWEAVIAECQQALAAFNKRVADQAKKTQENNELIAQSCMELQAFNKGDTEIDAAELRSNLAKVVNIAATQGISSPSDRAQLGNIRAFTKCDSSDEGPQRSPGSVSKFCANAEALEDNYPGVKILCTEVTLGESETNYAKCEKKKKDIINGCSKDADCSGTADTKYDECVAKTDEEAIKNKKEAIETLKEYMVSHKCEKIIASHGERKAVNLAVCGATSNTSQLNGKGIIHGLDQLAPDIGRALSVINQ